MKVFISHGGTELAWAERFRRHLAGRGVDAWVLPVDYPYRDAASEDALRQVLHESDLVIALLTPENTKSFEISLAVGASIGLNKPLVVVVPRGFDESKLPRYTRSAPKIIRDTPEKTAEALLLAKAAA